MSTSPSPQHSNSIVGASTAAAAPAPLFSSFDLQGLVGYINEKSPRNIIVMLGAGVSVAAGIPDFRSPNGVGLYSKLALNYPELAAKPERLFDLDAFRSNPSLFYRVMNEMKLWPDEYQPTSVHRFVKLLQDKGILKRCYTQNIDTLERVAGVSDELLVEAHGAFSSAHCIDCKAVIPMLCVESCAKAGKVPRCGGACAEEDCAKGEEEASLAAHAAASSSSPCRDVSADSLSSSPLHGRCGGLVKPDVVFFGESLPQRFFELVHADVEACDLLLIIGTSLKVFPFAMVPSFIHKRVPRVLVNMTRAGDRTFVFQTDVDGTAASVAPEDSSSSSSDSEEDEENDDSISSSSSEGPNATPLPADQLLHCYRDLLLAGDCQETIRKLTEALGWGEL